METAGSPGHALTQVPLLQEYWPAVRRFAEQHTVSEPPTGEEAGDEGVQAAVEASRAGVKPASAAGPLGLGTDQGEAQQGSAASGFKKEL